MAVNCWDAMECGKGPKAKPSETCPAATETRLDGMNSGCNGGRSCWVVSHTHCNDAVQGPFSTKLTLCSECLFFSRVVNEEYPNAASTAELLKLIG
jgi:hypothetical protein